MRQLFSSTSRLTTRTFRSSISRIQPAGSWFHRPAYVFTVYMPTLTCLSFPSSPSSLPSSVNPVTHEKLLPSQLVRLKFHKNPSAVAEGTTNDVYQDPVTFDTLTENSKIAAIRTTGNVYLYDTIAKLNFKSNTLNDLLTEEPFTPADVVIIQDPERPRQTAISVAAAAAARKKQAAVDINAGQTEGATEQKAHNSTEDAPSDLGTKRLSSSGTEPNDPKRLQRAHVYGSVAAAAAASAAAAAVNISSQATSSLASEGQSSATDEDELRRRMYAELKKYAARPNDSKGQKIDPKKYRAYVRIVTSLGNLNFELYAEHAPETCHNFVKLAQRGFYDGLTFHRLIPKFMVQGGDPLGNGRGGESAFNGGKPFADEIKLKHSERGMLAMANCGPNTNTSQFYITFAPAHHLDLKHTVFGRLVGGGDVLDKIEAVKTESGTDKPLHPGGLLITKVIVFSEPFTQLLDYLKNPSLGSQAATTSGVIQNLIGTWKGTAAAAPPGSANAGHTASNAFAVPIAAAAAQSGGQQTVGKYLKLPSTQ